MLTTLCLLLALSAPQEAPAVRFDQVESHLRAERWAKARKVMHRDIRALIAEGGAMDGGDLMKAVRYRALIEAGAENHEAAEWWWHIGLNLQSEGAKDVLALVRPEIAATLEPITVRPSRPPEKIDLPKLKDRPNEVGSTLFRIANQKLSGVAQFEIWLGPRGEFRKPLLIEATVPTAGIYAALDNQEKVRFPMEWRRLLGDTVNLRINFRGARN